MRLYAGECLCCSLRVCSTVSNRKPKTLPGTGSLPSDWNVTRISIHDEISESFPLRASWAFFKRLNQAPNPEAARQRCHLSVWMNQSGNYQQNNRIKGSIVGKFPPVSWACEACECHGGGLLCVYNINKQRCLNLGLLDFLSSSVPVGCWFVSAQCWLKIQEVELKKVS